jgi:EAL domain-containing protein (putative c-di-GMP-specific phosphodiesterase class I)
MTVSKETDPDRTASGASDQTTGGQSLYLRLLTQQLTGWNDPRAMLQHALVHNQFLLLAQKIISLNRGSPDPVCYEVLLRLQQEEENMLPPGGFLDLADSLGMTQQIDAWVVRALLAWGAARIKRGPVPALPLMCVNLSAASISSPLFVNTVREMLKRSDFPPRALCFEINEREIIEQHSSVQGFIQSLKPTGCRFTVDAFGSAKVSFSHLKGLAIDFIKIDGVIIQDIVSDPLAHATAKAINMVCHELGMRTIAEFVETKKTLDKLREIGVDYVQGFGIARPEAIGKIP